MAVKPLNRIHTPLITSGPQSPPADPPGRALAVSRHSVSLNTGLFTLGFSWQRLEVEPPQVEPATVESPAAPKKAPAKLWDGPLGPQEMRRRLDLAALLISPASSSPEDSSDEDETRAKGKALGPLRDPALKV